MAASTAEGGLETAEGLDSGALDSADQRQHDVSCNKQRTGKTLDAKELLIIYSALAMPAHAGL